MYYEWIIVIGVFWHKCNRRVIVDASCIFPKVYFTFYNRVWNSNTGTNFRKICGKFSMKLLSDIVVKIRILKISNMSF